MLILALKKKKGKKKKLIVEKKFSCVSPGSTGNFARAKEKREKYPRPRQREGAISLDRGPRCESALSAPTMNLSGGRRGRRDRKKLHCARAPACRCMPKEKWEKVLSTPRKRRLSYPSGPTVLHPGKEKESLLLGESEKRLFTNSPFKRIPLPLRH